MAWSNIAFDYSGATVLVTGGTSGIGAGIAKAYREAGADVIITGTRSSPEKYEADLSAYRYLPLNIEDKHSVDAAAGALDRLDILINNAGLALPAIGLDEWEPDNFDRAIAIHMTSAFRLATRCRALLRDSPLAGGASVIGLASMASYFGIEGIPGYGSGKTGLLGMTRVLAVHWARDNIRVNAVAPGLTHSRMTTFSIEDPVYSAQTLDRTPIRRFGMPEDTSGAVLFLTSAAARWITGQVLAVDGGFSISG